MKVHFLLPGSVLVLVAVLALFSGCTGSTMSMHVSSENGKPSVSSENVLSGCQPGHTNCSFSCVDLQSDDFNCGSCDTICSDPGTSCQQGTCSCRPGYTKCGDECVDLKNDNADCGRCGNPCSADEICGGGVCSDV